jgi:hypothetical protein
MDGEPATNCSNDENLKKVNAADTQDYLMPESHEIEPASQSAHFKLVTGDLARWIEKATELGGKITDVSRMEEGQARIRYLTFVVLDNEGQRHLLTMVSYLSGDVPCLSLKYFIGDRSALFTSSADWASDVIAGEIEPHLQGG